MNERRSITIWASNPEEMTTDDALTLFRILDAGERERYEAFKNDAAKRQYLLAHVLLRLLLSSRLSTPPEDHRFRRIDWHKPCIQEPEIAGKIDFTISHTYGSVACAVIEDGKVGIDLEYRARNLDIDSIAPTCLTQQELSYINSGNDLERNDRFLQIWTLKEAYLKGRGIGLQLPPTEIQVELFSLKAGKPRVHMVSGDDDDCWHFCQFYPTRYHIGALAYSTCSLSDSQPDVRHISIESMRNSLSTHDDANYLRH